MNLQTDYYGLFLTGYKVGVNSMATGEVELTFSTQVMGEAPDVTKFFKDLSLLNAIRQSQDPAVKDAFEQVLTTMALTNGRSIPMPISDVPPRTL